MTPKSVSVLAVLTVLSVTAAVASLNMKRNYANDGGSGLVFDKLLDKIDQVTKIVVKDNSRETVIIRSPDGVWSLPSSDNYPANVAQVQKSILQLAQHAMRFHKQ